MSSDEAPYHAHIYYSPDQRDTAESLHAEFIRQTTAEVEPRVLFVGRLTHSGVGPHLSAQFEMHFRKRSLEGLVAQICASGLRALIHPLTDDDLADHTTSGFWIGGALELDLTVLDPPGLNQGILRFGKTDF
jgi:DOPA 4,5-dioxygenase